MPDRLVFLDAESTSLDVDSARIVELCIFPLGAEPRVRRINPGVPIPAEATAVHGITDDDVKDCPRFRQLATAIQELLEGAILVGFNIRVFDSLLLDAELRRAGKPGLEREAGGLIVQPEIDLYRIWFTREARNLAAAAKRFAGIDLEETHSAAADTRVLPEVLEGMIRAFGLGEQSFEDLSRLCVPEDEVDRARRFVRKEDGSVVFAFGKNKDKPVLEDADYLRWMCSAGFNEDTKVWARQFLEEAYARERALKAVGAA